MKRMLGLVLLVLIGCPTPPNGDPPPSPAPDAGVATSVLQSAAINRLPKDADGNIPILTVGNEVVKLGPVIKDPVYGANRCRDLLSACMLGERLHPTVCAKKVHTCATEQPWEEAAPCCPKACVDEVVRLEAAGDPNADATVFGKTHPCFPGLVAQYCAAGGRPTGGCPVTP